MRTILQSLVWKEWHEHKWKLVSITVILWATAALALHYGQHDGFSMATVMVSFCIVPMSLFVGLGSAASERSRGTLAFLQALPVPLWRTAVTKLVSGLITLFASAALTIPLLYGWAHWVHPSTSALASGTSRVTVSGNIFLDAFLLFVSLAASFYIWSAAAGVNRKDEVSAGAMALAVITGWYAIVVIFAYCYTGGHGAATHSAEENVLLFGLSTAPGGFLPASGPFWDQRDRLMEWYLYPLFVLAPAITMHLALAGWYVWRFGRTTNREIRSPQTAVRQSARTDWLSPPRESATTAIAWKQFRESGPLVLAGLAGIFAIVIGVFCSNANWFLTRPGEFAVMATAVGICIGYAVTLIVGIGICFYDVSPQHNTFWRSRPINPDTWYWVKFVTGLLILFTTLFIPLLLVVLVFHPAPGTYMPRDSMMALVFGQAALFAAAVATTCLVRHAVYGAILSIPLMYLGVAFVWIGLKLAGAVGLTVHAPARMVDMPYSQLAFGFLFTFLVCAVLGWLAMRNDWGWKSRY